MFHLCYCLSHMLFCFCFAKKAGDWCWAGLCCWPLRKEVGWALLFWPIEDIWHSWPQELKSALSPDYSSQLKRSWPEFLVTFIKLFQTCAKYPIEVASTSLGYLQPWTCPSPSPLTGALTGLSLNKPLVCFLHIFSCISRISAIKVFATLGTCFVAFWYGSSFGNLLSSILTVLPTPPIFSEFFCR